MTKQAVFTLKLESDLRDDFLAEAAAAHRPASQVVRELMREYVVRQRESRSYDSFLLQKVETARISMRSGDGLDNADVEAEFSTLRGQVIDKR
ncbi:MAG: antitoxin of toxin-antitoxin stability system [Acidobacteria bacterium]|nr:antitoxin of toxin-antitoxin stability system [Acidobacteriota bacterium]